jgi:hypothetical protein
LIAAIVVGCGSSGGINPDLSDKDAESLMFEAALDPERIEEFYSIVNSGVDLNAKDESGLTALHYAADADNGEAVRVLLLSGADPEIMDVQGHTARDLAEQGDKPSAIQSFDRFDKTQLLR